MKNMKQKKYIALAFGFIFLFGIVSLFSDMTYEGGRSIVGQFLEILKASALVVGLAAGAGELLGYGIRFFSGYISDRTKKYWLATILGYSVQLLSLPMLVFIGRWELAIIFVFLERIGKGIRKPSVDAMLSNATSQTGRGFGFGLHEAMDQIGATLGPIIAALILLFKPSVLSNIPFLNKDTNLVESLIHYKLAFGILFIPAILAIITVIIAKYLYPVPAKLEIKTPNIGTKGFSKSYWFYLIGVCLIGLGFVDFALIGYHIKNILLINDFWIPIMYAAAMGIDAASALFFGYLYDKIGFKIIIIVFLISSVFAPFAYLGGIIFVIIGLGLWGIGMGAIESIMRAHIANLVSKDKRGTAFGLFHTGFGIAWFFGSFLIGFLYDINVMYLVVFSVCIQVCAVPIFILAGIMSKKVE